ncbi:MAG: hypothetical protein AAGE92_00065 [Cyanobacteria bacterium P01_G01_bin.4]
MNSGPDNVTTTTYQQPPEELRSAIFAAGNNARDQFLNQQTFGAGSSLVPGSQQVLSDTIQGNFLSPDTNPYLEQTFNRAADLTRTRLDSEFAGAGRNLGAAAPARSEELQTLASNIYGGNFQRERDRQVTALDQSLNFDPLNMLVNRTAGLLPGAGGATQSTQPIFRQGLF